VHRILRSLALATLTAAAAVPLIAPLVTPPASADDAQGAAALYKQGLAYKAQGKIDEAIAAFEKSVAIEPRNGSAWASLGHLYKKKSDHAKALTAYQEAVKYAPAKNDAVVWGNLGMAYYRADKVDDAKAALEQSIKLDGKAADVHSNLGVILRTKGDTAGALRELEQAVKLAPKDVYRRQQEVEKAIEAYLKSVALKPDKAEAWYDLGHMYKLDHEDTKAVEAFNKFLALNKGKDPVAQQEIQDEVKALGAAPAPVTATPQAPPPADPPASKPKKPDGAGSIGTLAEPCWVPPSGATR
jgi:tetratricopeptide (TPR) repeat protein